MNQYSWPGNVRELQSAVKHALLQATGPVVVPAYLPDAVRGNRIAPETTDSRMVKAEDLPGVLNIVKLTMDRLANGSDDI